MRDHPDIATPAPRVALLNPAGSAFGYVHSLANALAAAGAGVTVLTGPLTARAQAGLATVDYHTDVRFYRRSWDRDRDRHGRPPLARAAARAGRLAEHLAGLASVARDAARWHVLHVQWLTVPPLDVAALAWLARRLPVVYTAHNVLPHDAQPTRATLALWRRVYALPHRVIVHRAETVDELAALGVDPARVAVIPHGNFAYLREHGQAAPTARDDAPRVLFFGFLGPYKGLDVLLRAMPAVLAAHPRARLDVVGRPRGPRDVDEARALIAALGLVDAVDLDPRFVPETELAAVFARTSVVALPYRAIQDSGVAVTAATFGRPLVASDVGGLGDHVRAAGCGLLVPPDDPGALAGAIVALLDDPDRARALGDRGRAWADRDLAWGPIAAATLRAYGAASVAFDQRRR